MAELSRQPGEEITDPFAFGDFRNLPTFDQVAIIGRFDPLIRDPRFLDLDPHDQIAILGRKYPGFRDTAPSYRADFVKQLRGMGLEEIPSGKRGPEIRQAPSSASEFIDRLLAPLSIPQQYAMGALSGKPGEKVTVEEAFGIDPTDVDPDIAFPLGMSAGAVRIATDPLFYMTGGAATLLRNAPSMVRRLLGREPAIGPTPEQPFTLYMTPGGGLSLRDVATLPPGRPGDIRALAEEARQQLYGPGPSYLAPGGGVRPPQVSMEPSEFLQQPEAVTAYPPTPFLRAPGQTTIQPSVGPPTEVPPSRAEQVAREQFVERKPGFLQTAEERVREQARIPSAEDLLRQRFEAQAGLTVDDFLRPDAAAARARAYADMLKARAAEARQRLEPPTPSTPPPAAPLVAKHESGVPPSHDNTSRFRVGKGPDDPLEVEPGWWMKAFGSALDAVAETGVRGRELSNLLLTYMNKYERLASNGLMNLDADLRAIWGRRTGFEMKKYRKFNPYQSFHLDDIFKLTKEDKDQLVDYLYSGGTLEPKGINAAKIVETAKAFKKFGALVGEHEALPLLKGIMTSLGDYKPFGKHGLFMPQQPLGRAIRLMLQDRHSHDLFNRAKSHGYTGTFDDYKAQLRRILKAHEGIREETAFGEIESVRFAGLENARLFNAMDFGRPSEVLRRFGYNDDPLQAYWNYVVGGLRRLEGKLIEDDVSQLVNEIQAEIRTSSGGKHSGDFIRSVAARALGQGVDDEKATLSKLASYLIQANDATLLQFASVPQFNQMAYAVGRETSLGTLEDIVRAWRQRAPGLQERSGALFTWFMNEFNNPSTKVGQWASGQLRAQGFSKADTWGRFWSALVGARHGQKMAHALRQAPTNERLVRIMERGFGFSPEEVKRIAQVGRLDQDQELRAAQKFVNDTMGRTDIRTLPYWLTDKDPLIRLFGQYKKFLGSNAGELIRQWKLYGPWTAGKTAGSAIGLGEVTRDIQYSLTHFELPPTPGSPRGEERLLGPTKLLHKYSPLAARAIDDLAYGLGTVFAYTLYAALEPQRERVMEAIIPALGWAEPIADFGRGLEGTLEYKRLPWKPLARDIARRMPFIGPLGPSYVEYQYPTPHPLEIKPLQPLTPFLTPRR